jgi:dihydrofolate synthase / folylpolyglutamate synthase
MTYDEAIEWLLSFADFERSGRFQDRPDVAPMLALLDRLGNPHLKPSRYTIHIAGSKGKGSVGAMIDSVLRTDSVTTGFYTSPHLYSYTERIQVNGEPISKDMFTALATDVRTAVDGVSGTLHGRSFVTFDLLTAMGFLAYAQTHVGLQVIEVGLGGKVDSTNVFPNKEIAVITPISLEHVAILGPTIEHIARQKAGIITPQCTTVLAPQEHQEAAVIIGDAAKERLIDVKKAYIWKRVSHGLRSQTFHIQAPEREIQAEIPLLGKHQIENAATAVAAVDAMSAQEPLYCPYDESIANGLASVRWPCRIEVVREDPLVVVDGAHNRDSARRLAETLVEYFECDRALFVVGCGSDKDIQGLAEELAPLAGRVLAVRSEHPRAMDPQRIAETFGRLGVDGQIVDKVPDAVDSAIAASGDGALICVAGSLFVAAEARAHVLGVRT